MNGRQRKGTVAATELSINDVSRITGMRRITVGAIPQSKNSVAKSPASNVISDLLIRDQQEKAKLLMGPGNFLPGRKLDFFPKPNASVVRVFLSSTFLDMQLERNALMIHVYPRIRAYCRQEHGLEFQVVDMRWGVTEEVTDNHMAPYQCLQEIHECQKRSLGPNFLILLGQRYGWVPLHRTIPKKEFEIICNFLEQMPETVNDVKLLKEWYLEDSNSVPHCYVLQRISKLLPNYINQFNNTALEEARSQWSECYRKMLKAINTAVIALEKTGVFTEERQKSFNISVTHMEAKAGILDVEDAARHCLVYTRVLNDMPKNDFFAVAQFLDTAGFRVDTRYQATLDDLRDSLLNALPAKNKKAFNVPFAEYKKMQPFNLSECVYLRELVDEISNKLATLVSRAAAAQNRVVDALESEVIHHLRQSSFLSMNFIGCEDTIKLITDYVSNNVAAPALVISGVAGCGRSSTLAASHVALLKQYGNSVDNGLDHVFIVVRYLGTTSDSSSLASLLRSLCTHIMKLGIVVEPLGPMPSKTTELSEFFSKLVAVIPKTEKLIILLDALENLDRETTGQSASHWIPAKLPENVKLVVTVDAEGSNDRRTNWLQRLLKQRESSDSLIRIGLLSNPDAVTMFKHALRGARRKLTAQQQALAESCLESGALPLYVKLLAKIVEQWSSYDTDYGKPPATISGCINELVYQLEKSFGIMFVSRTFSYLTAAKVGLSQLELEDILSLDDDVLNEIYEWHLPPIRRLPALTLARLLQSLSGFVVERQSGTTTVLQWCHTSIRATMEERYFHSASVRQAIHAQIADYFLGTWAHRVKPFRYSSTQIRRFHLEDREYESDRLLCDQPYVLSNASSDETHFNLRKIVELPFGLIRAGRLEEALRHCFFNLQFLYSRLATSSVESLVADIVEYPQYREQPELLVLLSSLKLSATTLNLDSKMLGPHLLARLMPYYHSGSIYLNQLLEQCDSDGIRQCALVPVHHCMQTPGGPLQHSFEDSSVAYYGVCIPEASEYLFSGSNKLRVWSLDSGTMHQESKFAVSGVILALRLSPDSTRFAGFCSSSQVLLGSVNTFDIFEPQAIQQFVQPIVASGDRVIDVTFVDSDLLVWTNRAYCRYNISTGAIKTVDLAAQLAPIESIVYQVASVDTTHANGELIIGATQVQNLKKFVVYEHSADQLQVKFECSVICYFTKNMKTVFCCSSPDVLDVEIRSLSEPTNVKRKLRNREVIFELTVSHDEHWAVASLQHSFLVWDLRESIADPHVLQLPATSDMHNFPLPLSAARQDHVVFSANQTYLACAVKRYIVVYSLVTMSSVTTLDSHYERILSLTVNPNDSTFVSSSVDHTIKVWDFTFITAQQYPLSRLNRSIEYLYVNETGFVLAVTKSETSVWSTHSGRLIKSIPEQGRGAFLRAVLSHDAVHIVTLQERAVSAFLLSSLTQVWYIETLANSVSRIRLLSDNHLLIFKVAQGEVRFEHSEKQTAARSQHDMAVNSLRQQRFEIDCVTIESRSPSYRIAYEHYSRSGFVEPALTDDESFLCILTTEQQHGSIGDEELAVYSAVTGNHAYNLPLRYTGKRDIEMMCKIGGSPKLIALCDSEKAAVFSVLAKVYLYSIRNWLTGISSTDGRFGLSLSVDTGLQTMDLKTGRPLATLLSKDRSLSAMRTFVRLLGNQYVLFYSSETKVLKVFRVSDNRMIAQQSFSASITALEVLDRKVIIGLQDGTVMIQLLADADNPGTKEAIRKLPSRKAYHSFGVSVSTAFAVKKLFSLKKANKRDNAAAQ